MNKEPKIKLSRFETWMLLFFRRIKIVIRIFTKSIIVKIAILLLILGVMPVCALSLIKSSNYVTEGDFLYKKTEYKLALEKYKLASRWWIFDHISFRLQKNGLATKIQKTKVMLRSTEYYDQGKKDFEEGRYTSAKWNLSRLAVNDPRNLEAKDILQKIRDLEALKPTPSKIFSNGTNKSLSNVLLPTKGPTTTQVSYSYDPYYPIILSFSDNKGSLTKRSDYNKHYGLQSSSQTDITLKSGDTIAWKVQANDPKDRQLLYCFHSNSTRFNDQIGLENGKFKWRTSNEIQYTVSIDDIKSSGELLRIVVQIKSDKENLRVPGGEYDDTTYLDYKLTL